MAATLDQQRLELLTPALAEELNAMPELLAWLDRVHRQAPGAA